MREDVFEELLESVRQGGQILRGERKPGRVFAAAEPNARKIRQRPHERTLRHFHQTLASLLWQNLARSPVGAKR